MRQRLYNPAQLSSDELKASFIARQETLEELHRIIREEKPSRPCQHFLLIGPRGMGKTTLGLRFLLSIEELSEFSGSWQPVAFDEESYGIGDLADFWLTALDHLSRATDEPRWTERADAIREDESDPERQAVYARAALRDFHQESGKRIILFVENLDVIFGQLGSEREVHTLRASLIERSDILLVGSANTVFDAIRGHGQPFYEFFQLFILEGLGPEDTHRMLASFADANGASDLPEAFRRERGRLETVRRLTGGNPRLLVLACRMLIESPLGSPLEDLERLIDEQTPYFKARIEELPVQGRRVFHCLAAGWRPMLAKEVAAASKLSSSHASAQLRQLVEKGYARELKLPREKRVRYEVGDRFYNIYYLLRFSRTGRPRLERLVHFLHDLFGPTGMRAMYPATLDALRERGPPAGEMSDLLGILAGYVARDDEFTGWDDWRRNAINLANNLLGTNASVIDEIEQTFATRLTPPPSKLREVRRRGLELMEANDFAAAELAFREIVQKAPEDTNAWTMLGYTLRRQKRLEDALEVFEHVVKTVALDDSELLRISAFGSLVGESTIYFERDKPDIAISAIRRGLEYIRLDDSLPLRSFAVDSLLRHGNTLAGMGLKESALAAWERTAEFTRREDPVEIRLCAADATRARGDALVELSLDEEALNAWSHVSKFVQADDPKEIRTTVALALWSRGMRLFELKRYDESIESWRQAADYIRPDDQIRPRKAAGGLLTVGSIFLKFLDRNDEAETDCRRAMALDPTLGDTWRTIAAAILRQGDDARLAEAEDCARRAVEVEPDRAAIHTLAEKLARQGDRKQTMGLLELAIDVTGENSNTGEWHGLTQFLIGAVGSGLGHRVRALMKKTGLDESMEPLWHAVRAELGEELEPLPAEIMDTVTGIRRRFSNGP